MRAKRYAARVTGMFAVTVSALMLLTGPVLASDYPPQPPTGGSGSLSLTASSGCVNSAPVINYAVGATGLQHTIEAAGFRSAGTPSALAALGPITLTLRDSAGAVRSTMTVTSPSGQVLFPGAAVGADGTATDWPGWKLDNGVWVADPTDAIVQDGLTITADSALATVSPAAPVLVTYPSGSQCAHPVIAQSPPTPTSSGTLPSTGSSPERVLMIAGATLLAGLAIVGLSHRHRRRLTPPTP